MARSLSEQIVFELDTLWRMTLFVAAGSDAPVESLLLSLLAPETGRGGVTYEGEDGLERRLLKRFFDDAPPLPDDPPKGAMVSGLSSGAFDITVLLDEAGNIPPRARAALWLVMIQRRGHAEAASALGIAKGELHDLLRYRDVLLSRVVTRTGGRLGPAGSARGGDQP